MEHYLQLPFDHVFVCEKTGHCQRLLADTFQCKHYFSDCADLDSKAPSVDIFVAGPPCQPWSRAGLMMGQKDERFSPFIAVVRYIVKKRPKLCIIENVKDLTCKNNMMVIESLEAHLTPWYHVDYKVINSRGWVPQNRERVCIVCRSQLGCSACCYLSLILLLLLLININR
jgi:DNA (cytosine-5)-methyltransferase 1